MSTRPRPDNRRSYISYAELILNLEHAGLHRLSAVEFAMEYLATSYDMIVARAETLCTICGARDVHFVPFKDPNHPAVRVVRACQVCHHAEEL